MGGIRLVFSDQLHALLMIVFIGKGHPVADLHFIGRGGLRDDLGALQALLEVAPVAIEVSLALLVGQFAFGAFLIKQFLQFGDFRLKLRQARWRDVIGLRADLPFDWLIGLRGGVIFIDEGATHAVLPL
jgi:hypothetical protein